MTWTRPPLATAASCVVEKESVPVSAGYTAVYGSNTIYNMRKQRDTKAEIDTKGNHLQL